jgi:hypothetical protein
MMFGAVPRRPARRQGGDDLVDIHRGRLARLLTPGFGDGVHERDTVPADRRGFVVPPCHEFGDTVAGLVRAGIDGGLALDRGEFPLVRIPTLATDELSNLRGDGVVDLLGPLREQLAHFDGDAEDLGLAVDDRFPGDAEAVGEFVAQHRLVEAAEHPLVLLHVAGVERQPATVIGLDLG